VDGRIVDLPTRDTLIAVFKAHGGGVSVAQDGAITFVRDGIAPEVQYLTDYVPRSLAVRLAIRYKVPPEHLWHPEMAIGGSNPTLH